MEYTWKAANLDGFIRKAEVKHPVKLPSIEILMRSRAGLTKKIKNATSPSEKKRLKDIRDEYDSLIEHL